MDMRQWKDAESALGKAIELDQKLAAANLALEECQKLQGHYVAAEKPLFRGLELNPEAADGQFESEKAYWGLGRWQEAEPHGRKVLAVRPDSAQAHHLIANILVRKGEPATSLQEFNEYFRLEPNGPLATAT